MVCHMGKKNRERTLRDVFWGLRTDLMVCMFLAVMTLSAYWQITGHDFVAYDDIDYVTENRFIQKGLTFDNLIWAFTSTVSGNWHPLTLLSHMLDCQLFGLDAGLHHLTGLVFHIANSLLLFVVLHKVK